MSINRSGTNPMAQREIGDSRYMTKTWDGYYPLQGCPDPDRL